MSPDADAIIAEIQRDPLDLDAIASEFDEATEATRLRALGQLTPPMQRRLFSNAAGRSVTTEDLVPPSYDPLEPVIHEGQNTLIAFRSFQKRFCLPSPDYQPQNRRVLWGYNHQTFSGITGPGYFVAYDDDESDEVVIDYRELPPERPPSWPAIIDNSARLGRFVYAGMVDRLRRISRHVTIGRAYKSEPMNAYFTLVRTTP